MTNFERMRKVLLDTVSALDAEELRKLASDTGLNESGNGAVFSCSVCEKTYGRCCTFYNTDECTERYNDWCGREYEPGWENKAEIVDRLSKLLAITRIGSGIRTMALSEDKKLVEIRYEGGGSKSVNVDGDSGYAIIKDVLAAL